ncbi:hypothetical protein H4S00_000602 [Coemansia sp. D1744]|nr:hypothetical protein LPJ69_004936 [Coemansia sp. RSA 1752]KAJ2554216.1 hypothetical protein IWW35_001401 [Coemansia sp. RSA 1878]KAJ2729196.1 hypothetical protein H4S00_000602 [Coemansia sp. D1744]
MFGRSALRLACGARQFSTTRTRSVAVRASIILQRDPIVTQQSAKFEAAADQYFGWLDYMTADKFPREFFFKPGSSAENRWADQDQERALEWHFGGTRPKRPVTKKPIEEDPDAEEVEDDLMAPVVGKTVEVQPRETQADASNDLLSLERKLDRTLYLIVRDAKGRWAFPQSDVQDEEVLHEAARRGLRDMCGSKMSVWTVGCGPIGHHVTNEHTAFFVKAHILAGKAEAKEYKWVTREELGEAVPSDYWASVKDILSAV